MRNLLQQCLWAALVICLFLHSSSALQLNKVRASDLQARKFGALVQRSRGVEGTLTPIVRPQFANRTATVAQDVLDSAARLAFLSGHGSIKPGDDQSNVTAVPGSYAMSIEVGSPSQKFTAVADTGSDLIWIQCKPCSGCFAQPDPLFDPTKSSTYKTISCTSQSCLNLDQESCSDSNVCMYEYSYGDQSTTNGQLSSETISLDGNSIPKVIFGCGMQNQGTFNSVDGLVGLGLGPLSLPSQLSSSVGHKFSYCLTNNDDSPSESSPIVFGDSAVPSASSSVVYTPLVGNNQFPSFYYVTLLDINVGGKQLHVPKSTFAIDSSTGNGGTIFDSGTTITQMASAGYSLLRTALKAAITYPSASGSSVGLDTCFDVSGIQNATFPAVTFNFANADFVLPTSNTFVAIDNTGNIVCLAMASSSQGMTIFGNIQQQTFQVVYDVDNSRLGWVPSQC